jgi:probable F420-dependent oxidoreductase
MTSTLAAQLGRFGAWMGATQVTPGLAAELDRLGYGAIWLGGSPPAELTVVDEVLGATSALSVGTSIVNMWQADPAEVARSFARIEAAYPGRFILGVGAGHPEATQEYASPYGTLVSYVDALAENGVPLGRVALAALGPRVLKLSADRTGGALPYLTPPEHTRRAREILGPDALLAPEHKAVLDTDVAAARKLGSSRVQRPYLGLVNYTSNLRRLGYTDDDLAGGGSDRLIDDLVAHGTPAQVAATLAGHLDAGADHVCIQLLAGDEAGLAAGFGELAGALGLTPHPA